MLRFYGSNDSDLCLHRQRHFVAPPVESALVHRSPCHALPCLPRRSCWSLVRAGGLSEPSKPLKPALCRLCFDSEGITDEGFGFGSRIAVAAQRCRRLGLVWCANGSVSGRSDRVRAMDGSVTMRWFKPHPGKLSFSFLPGITPNPPWNRFEVG